MSEYFRKYIKKEHYPTTHFSNIKFKTIFRNCILDAFKNKHYKEVVNDDWDILWVERD